MWKFSLYKECYFPGWPNCCKGIISNFLKFIDFWPYYYYIKLLMPISRTYSHILFPENACISRDIHFKNLSFIFLYGDSAWANLEMSIYIKLEGFNKHQRACLLEYIFVSLLWLTDSMANWWNLPTELISTQAADNHFDISP